MAIHADTLNLPVPLPVRRPIWQDGAGRRPAAQGQVPQRPWRQRLYRLPPRGRNEGFTYGPDAQAAMAATIGRWIDLYV